MRWLVILALLNIYPTISPVALSSENRRPEIRDAIFQCRLSMNEYFELKDKSIAQGQEISEQNLDQALHSARLHLTRKILEIRDRSTHNSSLHSYERQLRSCLTKTLISQELNDFYLHIKHRYQELDCRAKLIDSDLKDSEVIALCEGARFFDIVFFKSHRNMPNIILLGESHVMGKEAENAGKVILEQFSLRGVEGYNGEFDTNDAAGLAYEFAMSLAKVGLFGTSNIVRARGSGYYLRTEGEKTELYFNKNLIPGLRIENDTSILSVRDAMALAAGAPLSINLERDRGILQEVNANCRSTASCQGATFHRYMIERRNDDMTKTLKNLASIPFKQKNLLAIVGSAHVQGISQRLKCKTELFPRVISDSLMGSLSAKSVNSQVSCAKFPL